MSCDINRLLSLDDPWTSILLFIFLCHNYVEKVYISATCFETNKYQHHPIFLVHIINYCHFFIFPIFLPDKRIQLIVGLTNHMKSAEFYDKNKQIAIEYTEKMDRMATAHRRTMNNNNIVQVHHPHLKSKHSHHHHHQQQQQLQPRHDDLANALCGGANCRYYYDSSSPTFPDLTPPSDMPTPHKSLGRKMPTHHQFVDDPDTIEFCVDDETACAKYYKDTGRQKRHKTYDPQVRWSRNNIAVTMERFQPIVSPSSASESSSCTSHTSHNSHNSSHNSHNSHHSHNSHQDYAYAYYEPGAIMCHSNIPTPEEVAGPSTMPPPNSMRALLMKCKQRNQRSSPASRHATHSRYGTHENIYEDVSDEKNERLVSSAQSLNSDRGCTKKEFQHILNNHYRVLEELNLSVEELLMSSSPPPEPAPLMIKRAPTVQSCVVDTLGTQLTSLDLKDDLNVGEIVIGEDSGFSGSSSGASCSYIGSLRKKKSIITRSLRRSSAPNCTGTVSSNGTIYGSCRTAKYPPTAAVEHTIQSHAAAPFSSCTVKIKHEKSPDSIQKSLKFALWNRRSWGKSTLSLLANQLT